MLALALSVAFTTTVTGHAGDWGDVSVSAAIDYTHVVASSLWVGGLLSLTILGNRSVVRWAPEQFGAITRHFSRLAGWSLLAVVLSGSYNAWVQVATPSGLWTTAYGRVLCVKLLIVVALVWLGAISRYTIVARVAEQRRGAGARLFSVGRLALLGTRRVARALLPSRFVRYVSGEALLGIGVLACTAVLADSTPARHATHLRHQAASGPTHVTMEELHKAGGVPQGWMFTPPPGDAHRGRDVFVRLACFTCHTVTAEVFPQPTGPGPDLTDVGAHHPSGYLLESILNPDAVIVQDPGYTDSGGRSIMPDYRRSLSVVDLLDLVAYLATLKGDQRTGASAR